MNYFICEFFENIVSCDDPVKFFCKNKHKFKTYNLKEHLCYLLSTKKRSKSQIIAESSINITYAYHIFSGNKNPSRDKVLALVFAFKLNVDEARQLLHHAGVMELSILELRDAVIVCAIAKKYTLMQANALLHELGLKLIE